MEKENKQLQTGWLAYDDVGLSIIYWIHSLLALLISIHEFLHATI